MEQFTNDAQTTLGADVASGATTISVASASGFPSSAQFRIRVDNEIMIVTAGAGTTTWTVTRGAEGTTATSHCNGALVTHIITAGALANLDASYIASGVLAVSHGGTNSATALNNNHIVVTSGGAIVEGPALTNGQLPIGSTGAAPVGAALTAGSNIGITNGAGSITVGLTGVVPVANGGTNSSTALNNNCIMESSGGAIVEGPALTNGQVLVGSSGGAPVAATITAGTNIIVTNSSGSITIAKATEGLSGSGTTTNNYTDNILTGWTDTFGLSLIFSIKNTGGTNTLSLQIAYTNTYGTTSSVAVDVAPNSNTVINAMDMLPGVTADPPPYSNLTFSVKSKVTNASTTFSWQFAIF